MPIPSPDSQRSITRAVNVAQRALEACGTADRATTHGLVHLLADREGRVADTRREHFRGDAAIGICTERVVRGFRLPRPPHPVRGVQPYP